MEMRVVHADFDGLDVAFAGALPPEAERALEDGRELAQAEMAPALVTIGRVSGHVGETGARGGYRWRLDTGPEGEVWFFKRAKRHDDWNIRVSVRAAALVARGWEGVKTDLYETLEGLGASVVGESIGRVDFAVDILAPEFEVAAENFIAPYQTRRSEHYETLPIAEDAFAVHRMGGGKISTVTLGKMPNRQVTLYNKRREVIDHRHSKSWWWGVWGLDKEEPDNQVWRVEVRLGKAHLKERWNVATWQEVEAAMADMLGAALEDVRYVKPGRDSNRARWKMHELWAAALAEVRACFGRRRRIAPGKIIEGQREVIAQTYESLIIGITAGYSVAREISPSEPGFEEILARKVYEMVKSFAKDEPDAFRSKRARAIKRLHFTYGSGYEHCRQASAP